MHVEEIKTKGSLTIDSLNGSFSLSSNLLNSANHLVTSERLERLMAPAYNDLSHLIVHFNSKACIKSRRLYVFYFMFYVFQINFMCSCHGTRSKFRLLKYSATFLNLILAEKSSYGVLKSQPFRCISAPASTNSLAIDKTLFSSFPMHLNNI